MKFAICINEGGVGEHTPFVRLDDEGAVKVLDPSKATLFSSKKDAVDWIEDNFSSAKRFSIISKKELDNKIKRFKEFLEVGTIVERVEFFLSLTRCATSLGFQAGEG